MPPRLSKRQQREQDDLLNLATTPAQEVHQEPEAAESSEDDAPVSKPVAAGFAAVRRMYPVLIHH